MQQAIDYRRSIVITVVYLGVTFVSGIFLATFNLPDQAQIFLLVPVLWAATAGSRPMYLVMLAGLTMTSLCVVYRVSPNFPEAATTIITLSLCMGASCELLYRMVNRLRIVDRARLESESNLQRMFRQARFVLWATDGELNIRQIYGSVPEVMERVAGSPITVLEIVEGTPNAADVIASHRVALSGESSMYEAEWNGMHFLASVDPLRDDSGNVVGTVGIALDITDRKRVEEQLIESQHRLAEAQRIAHMGFWDWDIVSDRLYWSDEVFQIFGQVPETVSSPRDAFWHAIPVDERKLLGDHLDNALAGDPYNIEHRIVRPDGEVRYVKEQAEVKRDDRGQPVRMLGTILDVTDLKRAEEDRRVLQFQMLHAQKLESLGVLAGGVAHDFNNLLVGILGNLELALDEIPPNSGIMRLLKDAHKAARRAADLCKQLLAYSGRGKFVIEVFDLNAVITDMIELIKMTLGKGIRIRFELSEAPASMEGDATQIRQVIMNLAGNAAEAIGASDGEIVIRTERSPITHGELHNRFGVDLPSGTYVLLTVEDSGCGMSEETQRRIFEPFYTTKFTGRGLGLSAVQGIVRGHHGAVRIDSREGEGTRFTVAFPCADSEVPRVEAESRPVDYVASGTILFVDDELIVRDVGSRLLYSMGFNVILAEDGEQALSTLKEHMGEISCAVIDLTMPRLNGVDTFRAMRELNPNLPVVLSSGYDQSDVSHHISDDRITGFVQKPYTAKELTRALRSAMSKTPDEA
ncbi:MAG: hypothetical protein AMXMBFR84_41110 [Candidatus Hydrogenedentota bacterium]